VELQAAADYVDSGQVWLTHKMHEGVADTFNEARRVAAKMIMALERLPKKWERPSKA
jgi:hypothetical protein